MIATKRHTEDFRDWMRPKLRAYYNSKIAYLRNTIDEVIPEKAHDDFMKCAFGHKQNSISLPNIDIAMYQPMRQYLKVSGKLFRPLITCMFIEGFGKNPDLYRPIIAISEIIHSSSLILDDIADASLLRRGAPCSHLIYGIPRAANASCAMTFYTFRLIQSNLPTLSTDIKNKLYGMLLWEHYVTELGSALDLGWAWEKNNHISEAEFIQHLIFRSCSYTYRHAALLGAISAGANDTNLDIVFKYSTSLGIAFQLIDDILNLKPPLDSWGKTTAEDITEGKRSLLVLYTLRKATRSDNDRLLKILDGKVTDQAVLAEAIAIIEKYKAFEYVLKIARKKVDEAIQTIYKTRLDDDYKLLFEEFASYVIERKI